MHPNKAKAICESPLPSWREWRVIFKLNGTYQNLNSGRRLMNGLYSSVVREGKAGPSSSGSTCGERKPSTRLRL